jgi:comEA protein
LSYGPPGTPFAINGGEKEVNMFKGKGFKPTACLVLGLLLVSFSAVLAEAQTAAPKININTASAADFQKLPRIGPQIAQRIIDFRTQNGPFKRVEELMKVKGIGEKLFDQIKDRVMVGAEAQSK